MRLTPEQLRNVFAQETLDEEHAIGAIQTALDELEWHLDPDDKAESPYSIAKLTEGLPHRDRIIDLAIREARFFKKREQFSHLEIREHRQTQIEFKRAAGRVAVLTEALRLAKEESEDLEDIRKMGFLKRLRFLITKRL